VDNAIVRFTGHVDAVTSTGQTTASTETDRTPGRIRRSDLPVSSRSRRQTLDGHVVFPTTDMDPASTTIVISAVVTTHFATTVFCTET